MAREYPDRPVVGVGGVVIEDGKTLLIRRASEPLRGQWSIPGGTLELGESLEAGVAPPVDLAATHAATLEWVQLSDLVAHAL